MLRKSPEARFQTEIGKIDRALNRAKTVDAGTLSGALHRLQDTAAKFPAVSSEVRLTALETRTRTLAENATGAGLTELADTFTRTADNYHSMAQILQNNTVLGERGVPLASMVRPKTPGDLH